MKKREDFVLPLNINESNLSKDNCLLNLKTIEECPKLSLADITLSLDDIIPSDDSEKLLLDEDDGLKVILSYTKNKPCNNTSVVVISIINKSKFPVDNVQLDASVKKVLIAIDYDIQEMFKNFFF